VLDTVGYRLFAYPVRRTTTGWLSDGIEGEVEISPTHWREMPWRGRERTPRLNGRSFHS
jgi:hypothetical protein